MRSFLIILWIASCATTPSTSHAQSSPSVQTKLVPRASDDTDQHGARVLAAAAFAGREARTSMALAEYRKGLAVTRRNRILSVFTEIFGPPSRRADGALVWRARRTITAEITAMGWGEILSIVVD